MSASGHPPTSPAGLRRIVTGENGEGRSLIVFEGLPANASAYPERAGLFEIWAEDLVGDLDPHLFLDLAGGSLKLSPDIGCVRARWFVVEPLPEHVPAEKMKQAAIAQFAALGAEHELADQDRHPFMHRTNTLDVVVLLKGDASLVLDEEVARLAPGDVVIQRGAAHAWIAHDGPALFLAVLIARGVSRPQG